MCGAQLQLEEDLWPAQHQAQEVQRQDQKATGGWWQVQLHVLSDQVTRSKEFSVPLQHLCKSRNCSITEVTFEMQLMLWELCLG